MKTRLFFVLLFFISFQLFSDNDFFTEKESETIRRGNKIISAVELYFIEKSGYPDTLDELVPNFIEKIPRTGLNNGLKFNVPFRYYKYPDEQHYSLSCRYYTFSELYYDSDVKKWEYANH